MLTTFNEKNKFKKYIQNLERTKRINNNWKTENIQQKCLENKWKAMNQPQEPQKPNINLQNLPLMQ